MNGNNIATPQLSIREAQDLVDNWIRTTGVRYFSELTNMAILTEEVGEVARLMSRLYGDQSFKESDKGKELSDELADVLWVLICIANQTGVDRDGSEWPRSDRKHVQRRRAESLMLPDPPENWDSGRHPGERCPKPCSKVLSVPWQL